MVLDEWRPMPIKVIQLGNEQPAVHQGVCPHCEAKLEITEGEDVAVNDDRAYLFCPSCGKKVGVKIGEEE